MELFDKTIERSFSISPVTGDKCDKGSVVWDALNEPQDTFTGSCEVTFDPNHSFYHASNKMSNIFQYKFDSSSTNAQKAATLFFQKNSIKNRLSFTTSILDILDLQNFIPGKVITLYNDKIFRMVLGVIMEEITFHLDGKISVSGIELQYMNEWNDLNPDPVSIVTDTTEGNMD
jgi:hypothetical protein